MKNREVKEEETVALVADTPPCFYPGSDCSDTTETKNLRQFPYNTNKHCITQSENSNADISNRPCHQHFVTATYRIVFGGTNKYVKVILRVPGSLIKSRRPSDTAPYSKHSLFYQIRLHIQNTAFFRKCFRIH